MTEVRMRARLSGTYKNKPFPAPGEVFETDAAHAARLLSVKAAVPVEVAALPTEGAVTTADLRETRVVEAPEKRDESDAEDKPKDSPEADKAEDEKPAEDKPAEKPKRGPGRPRKNATN